jgi:CMP-N-acetylneuraminic acid synthetase
MDSESYGILLDAIEVQDIDNEMDWKLAELKYELVQSIN